MNRSRKVIAFLTALVLFAGMAAIPLPEEIFPMTGAMAATSPSTAPATDPAKLKGDTKVKTNQAYYIIHPDDTATYSGPVNTNIKTATIPSTIIVKGKTYKVTKIGSRAFQGCKKLKTVKIKSKYLKKISNTAFKGLKKSKIKVMITKKLTNKARKIIKKQAKKAGIKTSNISIKSF